MRESDLWAVPEVRTQGGREQVMRLPFFRRREETERVVMCKWPTGCDREATKAAIDFDYAPVQVYRFCDRHATKYKEESGTDAIFEDIRVGEKR